MYFLIRINLDQRRIKYKKKSVWCLKCIDSSRYNKKKRQKSLQRWLQQRLKKFKFNKTFQEKINNPSRISILI